MAETQNAEFLEEFMKYFDGKQAEGWDYQRAIKEFIKIRKTKEEENTETVANDIVEDVNESISDNVPDEMNQTEDNSMIDDSIVTMSQSDIGKESPESDCAEYVTIESTSPEPEEIINEPEEVLPKAHAAPFLSASKAFKLSAEKPPLDIEINDELDDMSESDKAGHSKPHNGMIDFNKVAIIKIKRISKRRIEKYTQRGIKRHKLNAHGQINSSEEKEKKQKKKLKYVTNKTSGSKPQIKTTKENNISVIEKIPEEICKSPDLSLTHSHDSSRTPTTDTGKQTTSATVSEIERIPVSRMKRIPKKTRTQIENEEKENTQSEWVQPRDLMPEVNESQNVEKNNILIGNGLVKYVKKSPLRRETDCSFELGVFLKEIQCQVKSGIDVTSPPGGRRAYAKKMRVKEEEHKKRLKKMRFEIRDQKRGKPYDRKSFGNSNKEPIGSRKSGKQGVGDGRKRLLNLDGNNRRNDSNTSSKKPKYDDNKLNELDKIVSEKRSQSSKDTSNHYDTNGNDKRRDVGRMLNRDSSGSDRRSQRSDERKSDRNESRKSSREEGTSQFHDALKERRSDGDRTRKTTIDGRRETSNRRSEVSTERRRDTSADTHRGRSDYSEKRDHRTSMLKDDRISNRLSERDSSTRNGKEENSRRSFDRGENHHRSSSNERRCKTSVERSMDVRKRESDRYNDIRSKSLIRNDYRNSPAAARRHSPIVRDKESSRSSPRVSDHLGILDRRPSSEYNLKDKYMDPRRRDRLQDQRSSIYDDRSRIENPIPRRSPYGEKKRPHTPETSSPRSPLRNTSSSPLSFIGRDEGIEKLISENQNLIKENRKFIAHGRVTSISTDERRPSRSISDSHSHTDDYHRRFSTNHRSDRMSHHSGSPSDSSVKSSYTGETSKVFKERSDHGSLSSAVSYLSIPSDDWLTKRLEKDKRGGLDKMGRKKS